jgi:hypothetical protein
VAATQAEIQAARDLLRKTKAGGVSLLYLNAPPPVLLSLADEEGVLIVEGARDHLQGDAAAAEMVDLMQRDRAHPCILGWNLRDAEEKTIRQARQLDPSRFMLTGSGKSARLWLPQGEPDAVPPPPGFLLVRTGSHSAHQE